MAGIFLRRNLRDPDQPVCRHGQRWSRERSKVVTAEGNFAGKFIDMIPPKIYKLFVKVKKYFQSNELELMFLCRLSMI